MNPAARALLWSLIIVGVAVGAIWVLSGREKGGLERRAVEFLKVYWAEDFASGDTMLTRSMLSPMSRTKYGKMREYYLKALGPWRGTYRVVLIESDGEGGGDVTLEGTFERAKAIVRLELRVDSGALKIADIAVDFPREVVPKADWHDPRVFTQRLLLRWCEGNVDVTWEQFGKRLRRRYPLEVFRATTNDYIEEAGDVGKVEVTSVDESKKDNPVVNLTAAFPDGERPATIELAWVSSRWAVQRFEVEGLK